MSESRVFRRSPSFMRSEVIQWNYHPVPISIELGGPSLESDERERLLLHRQQHFGRPL